MASECPCHHRHQPATPLILEDYKKSCNEDGSSYPCGYDHALLALHKVSNYCATFTFHLLLRTGRLYKDFFVSFHLRRRLQSVYIGDVVHQRVLKTCAFRKCVLAMCMGVLVDTSYHKLCLSISV